jgi:hypothetical protein
MRKSLPLIGACIAAIGLNCANLAGSGSTTTNGYSISGKIYKPDGTSAPNVVVMMLPQDYDPVSSGAVPDSLIVTTDDSGACHFAAPRGSAYTISSVHLSDGMKGRVFNVNAGGGIETIFFDDTLKPTGSISVESFDNGDTSSEGYYYIPGTTLFADKRSARSLIEAVPACVIWALDYGKRDFASATRRVRTNVVVHSGDTAVIGDNYGWKYSKHCALNTTASGAGVAGNVMGFPVLVRLTSTNFDFSQASATGADIRFAKSDSTPLPYEIERWDSVINRAEIWVKVDTVYGNDSSHFIIMFWGAPSNAVTGLSSGAAVFDTGNGFVATWHLDKNANDATSNKNNGVNHGAADFAGATGYGMNFNGADSIEIPGLLGRPASVTLSAWVLVDSANLPSLQGGDVISLGDAVLIRVNQETAGALGSFHVDSIPGVPSSGDSAFRAVSSHVFLSSAAWHFLAFTVDVNNGTQTFFIDGSIAASASYAERISYSNVGTNTFIGVHGNNKWFHYYGGIDEVNVCKVARSPDWIRLCSMNQKQKDALVTFAK